LSPQLGATARLDLGRPMDEILAGMKSKTRYNARLALRKGVEVFEAGPGGPETLARLLRSTAERQHFSRPMSRAELEAIVSIMRESPEAKIFLASVGNAVVSGALLIGFGPVAIYKRGAWNGEHGDAHPNEAMHVHMIEWARSRGYRTYDFDGMHEDTARGLIAGEDVTPDGVTRFKLSFGSDPVLRPPAYARFRQPFAAANAVASRLPGPATRRLESWLRRRI
jgi:lipid II:glycine glycyltransferase (peptidoglycan interpeptide bridge formation enzyme)